MKQRMSLLSPAITALLLCGAFATPVAFAQTHHKHKKTTTTESSQTTSNDAGTTNTTSTDTTTTATGDTSTMGNQSTSTYGSNSATPATPATPYPGTGTAATPATPATPADAAAASMGATPKTMSWSDLDTDHNGSISKSEASSLNSLSQVFDAADANHDGSLTADEYRAYLKTQGK